MVNGRHAVSDGRSGRRKVRSSKDAKTVNSDPKPLQRVPGSFLLDRL